MMRNFEERKAEVFRRSENRIQERKRNRNRILALCIPLCLVLIICSVSFLPAMRPFETDKAGNENPGTISHASAGIDGANNPSSVHSFVLVDVKGTGAQAQHHSAISDAPSVNAVFEQIYTILIPHESHNDLVGSLSDGAVCVPDGDGSEELMDFASETKASGYIITMTSANGVKRTFVLTGNKLQDAELHIEIELTDEQICSLKLALGLTD